MLPGSKFRSSRSPRKLASAGTLPLVASSETMSVIPIQANTCTGQARSTLWVALVPCTARLSLVKKLGVVSSPRGSVERKSSQPEKPTAASRVNRVAATRRRPPDLLCISGFISLGNRRVRCNGGSERHVHAEGDHTHRGVDPQI